MKSHLLVILIITPFFCLSQVCVTGNVFSKYEKLGMPGAMILEKGTTNGTLTDSLGKFSIIVKDLNPTLLISFLGYKSKEVKIGGKTLLSIKLEEDCSLDWFDTQNIGLKIVSGIINTPLGGQLDFSPPPFIRPNLKGFVSYQTNLKSNKYLNSGIGLYHLFATCNFNLDLNIYYSSLNFQNNLSFTSKKLQTNFNLNKLGIIAGFGQIKNNKIPNEVKDRFGPTIGFVLKYGHPWKINFLAKSTIYKDLVEYSAEIDKPLRRLVPFIRFYHINGFNELSLGIGREFSYAKKVRW